MKFFTCLLCLCILAALLMAAWVISGVGDPTMRVIMLVEYALIEGVFILGIILIARLILK